jgi:hypothetical protein
MEISGGQPAAADTLESGCIVQRLVLRPGEIPGMHKLVRVTEEGAGRAIDIGLAAPRAVIRHAGNLVSGEAAPPVD